MRTQKVKNISLSALLSALSLVLLWLSALFPQIAFTILAVCGVITAISLCECGYKYSLLMYATVSILSLILSPDKVSAFLYIFLFGHYPIVGTALGRIKNRWLVLIIKLALANALFFICLFVTLAVSDEMGILYVAGGKLFFVAYNIAFLFYDFFIKRFVFLYISKRNNSKRFH